MPRILFVSGFHPNTRARDLAYEFERYGPLIRCDVPAPRNPRSSSNPYAFVEFRSTRDAEEAYYDMHGRFFDGYRLSIQWAKNPPSSVWRYERRSPPPRSGGSANGAPPPRDREREPRRDRERSRSPRRVDDIPPMKDDRDRDRRRRSRTPEVRERRRSPSPLPEKEVGRRDDRRDTRRDDRRDDRRDVRDDRDDRRERRDVRDDRERDGGRERRDDRGRDDRDDRGRDRARTPPMMVDDGKRDDDRALTPPYDH
ncbi:hypothetical protein JAAARDRAFT_314554 [Jaapia argillacea MUCL 33604]|uniref:RRM domain-containing protein n=1 Tax=Jaapia argillacea MUCL 33604 TaxID=933084 RepID=A0A067PQ45_9AGAM|nr:hypothetical protein JAAARDRAFT_314554 [Jaapia argillacea MUCL 33604]